MKAKTDTVPRTASPAVLTAYQEATERYAKALYHVAESIGALSPSKYEEHRRVAQNGRILFKKPVDRHAA
jgi:hypothetical protein